MYKTPHGPEFKPLSCTIYCGNIPLPAIIT
jgi:hypothetical protein